MSKTHQPEKEEPHISEEFSTEIEKYAKLEGISPEKFIHLSAKDRLEKLKKIYPDKPSKMDFLEYDKKIATPSALMCDEIIRLEEKLSDFLLEKSYEFGSYPEGGEIPPTEAQEKKIIIEDYGKNIVGQVAKMRGEIRRKQDKLDKFVLDFIEKYGVESEENIEALCPSGCGTKLIRHTFFDVFELDMEPSLQNAEEDLYCPKCGIRWIAEQHNPLNTKEAEKAENTAKKAGPIEYEQVLVNIPKGAMELLRHSESITGDTPQQDIEYAIVESVRARIDGGQFLPTREALVKQYNLNPVFKAILDWPVE